MTAVRVTLGAGGELLAAEASGHAGTGKKGADVVCAAVTVLLRTTLSVMASAVKVDADTAGPGTLSFRVATYEEAEKPLLRYAGTFLLEGIGSLEREYPGAVVLKAEKRVTRPNKLLED